MYVKWEDGNGMTENGERRPITGSKIVTKIQKFEDLEVWKEGVRLSVEIYKSLGECKDYSLRDQIQRSAVSIPSKLNSSFKVTCGWFPPAELTNTPTGPKPPPPAARGCVFPHTPPHKVQYTPRVGEFPEIGKNPESSNSS